MSAARGAWLNVIISEELYDKDFVDRWCYGFEELAERVKTMPVEKAAEIWMKIAHLPLKNTITDAQMHELEAHFGVRAREGYLL